MLITQKFVKKLQETDHENVQSPKVGLSSKQYHLPSPNYLLAHAYTQSHQPNTHHQTPHPPRISLKRACKVLAIILLLLGNQTLDLMKTTDGVCIKLSMEWANKKIGTVQDKVELILFYYLV